MTHRILFLTPQQPYPLHQGTTIRNFGLIKGLADRGHSVFLLSFAEPNQPPLADTPLPGLCTYADTLRAPGRTTARRLFDLLSGHVDMARRLWSPVFLARLKELLAAQPFDAIHFEGIEIASYLPHIQPFLRSHFPDSTLLYDAHNAETALQQRIARQDARRITRWHAALYSFIQMGRLRRLEAAICGMVDHVLAVSEADAAHLRALNAPTPITVVPNAIDVDSYAASASADLPGPALVFTGKMDYRPNVDAVTWFAEEILPLIRAEQPGARFVVVGQKPHPRVTALGAREDVLVTGRVPEIEPYIAGADVYVAPLRMGSGTRLKLLEAMAMRAAVVSTTLGAEGLGATDGQHLRLADTPVDFAGAVLDLLGDPPARRALGERARAHVRVHYDWSAIIPTLEDVYARHTRR